jgi:hypothetical protein
LQIGQQRVTPGASPSKQKRGSRLARGRTGRDFHQPNRQTQTAPRGVYKESLTPPGVEPYAYLCDVLRRIADYPVQRIAEILPMNWKPAEA